MTNQYAIRRLHSIVHYDPRFLPNELTVDQMDDDFVQELFDDMMNKVVELQADIYEMRQLQSQIAKKYVAMA
jgi:hypothetical protein